MSSSYFINTLRFTLLILAQVLVFNKLNFFGFINPFVYILFLYWYPVKDNRVIFISMAFLLGLIIDVFSDTLAFHTVAVTTVAFFRPLIMRFIFGVNYEYQTFKLKSATKVQRITFLALLIITHHIIFFSLEIFGFANLLLILKKTVFTFCGTLIICLLLSSLFSLEKK